MRSAELLLKTGAMETWSTLSLLAAKQWGTPLFAFRAREITAAFLQLAELSSPIPVRHWLSCKTLSLSKLFQQWKQLGHGLEVVSAFEFHAALVEGYAPERILINGPAKHRWLHVVDIRRINVQFDSLEEIRILGPIAKRLEWSVGIRLHTSHNLDPDDKYFPDQFGLAFSDLPEAIRLMNACKLAIKCISFHIHSNLRTIEPYLVSIAEIASAVESHGLKPNCIDIGGGLPVPGESIDGVDGKEFEIDAMTDVFTRISDLLPNVREIWLENGRFISSRAGVLIVRVWDIKQHGDMRFLICDGGRVNHAIPSDWQEHPLTVIPHRNGTPIPTTVCGPTCMAYDHLVRCALPNNIRIGDIIIWHNAGAYHLGWETRFSGGIAPIVWFDEGDLPHLLRSRESFESWWPSNYETYEEH